MERIIKSVLAIKKKAVAPRKEELRDLERCVTRVGALLTLLNEATELSRHPTMSGPLDDLAESLEEALKLVTDYQELSTMRRFLAAGDMVKQLRQVHDDILRKLTLGNFANTVHLSVTLTQLLPVSPFEEEEKEEHKTSSAAQTDPPFYRGPYDRTDLNHTCDQRILLTEKEKKERKKDYIMDSGAAFHSTYKAEDLTFYRAEMKLTPPTGSIQGFGGSSVSVQGYGYRDAPMNKLDFVMYIPDSTAKVVSLGQLTRDYPVKVTFYENKFYIERREDGERIGGGHRDGSSNHYVTESFQGTLLCDDMTLDG